MPGVHEVEVVSAEFGVVEDGVAGTLGGRGVGGGGDGLDLAGDFGEVESGLGEVVPGGLAVGDGVVEADGEAVLEDGGELEGEVIGGGWGDDLVIDDGERFAGAGEGLAGEFDHDVDEVEAAFEFAAGDAEEAAGTDDVASGGSVGEGHGVSAEAGEGVDGGGGDGGGFGEWARRE